MSGYSSCKTLYKLIKSCRKKSIVQRTHLRADMLQPLQLSKTHSTTVPTKNFDSADYIYFLKKTAQIINVLAVETYTTFRYVVPASIAWVWRKYVCNEIKTIEITVKETQQVAYLNIHGKLSSINNGKLHPLLLSHGDFGHPYTMLHLADIAQKEGIPTFSLYIPGVHNNQQFETHNEFLKQAIDKIENYFQNNNGNFAGILGTGHSKGAILLAQRQFVNLDQRIKAMCAIGGRLNVPNKKDCSDKLLTDVVKNIYGGIINNPKKILVQIIPKHDWNASQESMAARPNDHCFSVPGMHLSGLYKNETRNCFTHFLREFSQ